MFSLSAFHSPPIRHHDHQIRQAQFEARVPAHTLNDDRSVEVPSFEQIFDRENRCISSSSSATLAFAPEPSFLPLARRASFGFPFPEAAAGMGQPRPRACCWPPCCRHCGCASPAANSCSSGPGNPIGQVECHAPALRGWARSVYFWSTNQASQTA